MTPADVKTIREALGRALGRRVSCRDLGLALGLAPANAGDTVRSWEDGSRDVSGPAAVALDFMRDGTDVCHHNLPDYRIGILRQLERLFRSPERRLAQAAPR